MPNLIIVFTRFKELEARTNIIFLRARANFWGTVPGILKQQKPHINFLSSCQMRCAETIRLMEDKQGLHLSTMYECVYVCTHVARDLNMATHETLLHQRKGSICS